MLIGTKKDRVVLPASEYTWSAEEFNQIISEMLNAITSSGQTPTADDLTQFTKAIQSLAGADLAKKDLSNVEQLAQSRIDGIMPSNMDYVIETYKSGDSWYRKYKSGWIEQGGYISSVPTSSTIFTLITPYSIKHLAVIGIVNQTGASNNNVIAVSNLTLSTFQMVKVNSAQPAWWRSIGY